MDLLKNILFPLRKHFKKNCTLITATILILNCGFFVFTAFGGQPDSGQIISQEKQFEQNLPQALPQISEEEAAPAPLAGTGIKVLVKGFKFTGDFTIATEAELRQTVSGSIGKELDFSGLQDIAKKVTDYLRSKKGYLLARAYLPEQDVTSGIIEITILAGRIEGNVKINLKDTRSIDQALLERISAGALAEKKAIRLKDVERAVLLINDLPGISARASLEPGISSGTTRVLIDTSQGPFLNGVLSADNYGNRYTGTWRRILQASLNEPFGSGSQIVFSFINANHLYQGRAEYSLPVGARGLMWRSSYSKLYYELASDFKSLQVDGSADTFETSLKYPLMRTRPASIWTGIGVEYLLLKDKASAVTTSERNLPAGNINLSGNFFDEFLKGGLTNISLTYYNGVLNFSEGKDDDLASARSYGNFSRGTYSLARLQGISKNISFFGSARGQIADNNLDSSQKFILGGPTGVRAYPVGEGAGDEGHAFTFEARVDLSFLPSWASTQLIGFFDTGCVRLHKKEWSGSVTNAAGRNSYWLSGAGPGIVVGKPGVYSVRLSYAKNIGDNPGRNMDDSNSDNRKNNGRFWMQAVVWF